MRIIIQIAQIQAELSKYKLMFFFYKMFGDGNGCCIKDSNLCENKISFLHLKE